MLERVDTIAAELSRMPFVGLDTEFMREKTFFAELCLVQVATNQGIYCVDPLADLDMPHFWGSVMDTGWVVHSARQDIEVIYQAAERMPAKLFDTQIAAGLLGYAPQMGYASLVNEFFNVEIPKSHTRADWSRRPLSDAVLQYAAEDVEYLLPAQQILTEKLDQQGRLDWALEDSALLLSPALYDIDPALAINRMKGARNLRGPRRAAAARLAAWRESEALRANRPRQWIAKDAALIEVARKLPQAVAELEDIDDLPAGLVRRSGKRPAIDRARDRAEASMLAMARARRCIGSGRSAIPHKSSARSMQSARVASSPIWLSVMCSTRGWHRFCLN